jgi:hypothetical protein
MATPWLEFTNCRIRFPRPSAGVVSLRTGPDVTTDLLAVEAVLWILTGANANQFTGTGADRSAMESMEQGFKGYVTRWAPVPSNEGWLNSGLAWDWDTSGKAPQRLFPSQEPLDAYLGPISMLPDPSEGQMGRIRLSLVGSDYGSGGIGELLIDEMGSKILGDWVTLN